MEGFDCFGSSSSSNSSSGNISSGDESSPTLPQNLQGVQLREEHNQRQVVAERMRFALPITSPNFEVFHTTNNRGQGLRALKECQVGEEILREHPVMRIPNQQAASSEEEAHELHHRAVQRAFEGLSPETKNAVLSLSNNHCTDPISSLEAQVLVYQTNSYRLGSEGAPKFDHENGGLFLTAARINHSCRPNVLHYWRPDLQQTVVHAVRTISAGEEILTCYGPAECHTTSDRQSYLQEHLSFWCQCDMCMEGNTQGGDDRMAEICRLQEEIRDQLVDATRSSATVDSVEKCRKLLQQQGLDQASGTIKSLLRYGYQAASSSTTSGSEELAVSYLRDLKRAVGIGEGQGSANYHQVQQMILDHSQ